MDAERRNRRYDIDIELLEQIAKMSPGERMQRWFAGYERIKQQRLTELREQYPDLSERELILKMIESFEEG
jgi:hypothetical protein